MGHVSAQKSAKDNQLEVLVKRTLQAKQLG